MTQRYLRPSIENTLIKITALLSFPLVMIENFEFTIGFFIWIGLIIANVSILMRWGRKFSKAFEKED